MNHRFTSIIKMKKTLKHTAKFFDGSTLGVLSGTIDRYKGIAIATESLGQTSAEQFSSVLSQSVEHYKELGFRSIWLKLSKKEAHLTGVATNGGGFDFHHAKSDYVMLTKWIDPKEGSQLPGFASHYVGVGGLVLDSTRTKLLCIQE